jgi:diguanylate cyclase
LNPPGSTAAAVAPSGLRLEQALHLLQASGMPAPEGEPGSLAWMQGLVDALVMLSSRDALTALANRRSFELTLARECDRVARSGEPALLLALDIDHFKNINDQHGHATGDRVIQAVARALQDSVRPMDLVARVGGEEFAIVLPNCPPSFGQAVAERVRRRVATAQVGAPGGEVLAFSVSVGGAFAPAWVRSTPALWLERSDRQLYRAKAEGRNRVCLEAAASPAVSAEERNMLFPSYDPMPGALGAAAAPAVAAQDHRP